MRICIDGIGISMLQGTGLYSYTYEFLNNLFDIYPQPDYGIIYSKNINKMNRENNKKISFINITANSKSNRNALIKKYISDSNSDIYHSINNGLSLPFDDDNRKCKYVITVHDVIAAENSRLVDKKYSNNFQKNFPIALKRADGIVAVSDFIKDEIIKKYGISENKITVIYPGCGDQFRHIECSECKEFLKNKYNINGDIILFAGSIHIRKNLKKLIYIFNNIVKYNKKISFVILGKNDGKRYEYYIELRQIVRNLNLEDKVYFIGTVQYDHMPYFYNAAKCVVNISEYEGFPMSTIEALCCGIPVICSNTSSFIEVVKHKGILVHTDNEKQIEDAIFDVINDNEYRKEAIKNIKEIKEEYSWSSSIKKYVRLYENLVFKM